MAEDKVTGERMIAHINESGKVQTVKNHSEGTACLSQQFAEGFGCGKQGYFCGLLHDIGGISEADCGSGTHGKGGSLDCWGG